MDLARLRRDLRHRRVRLLLSGHARIEVHKDGLPLSEVERTVLNGVVVEDCPDRDRKLLLGFASGTALPCHAVLEYAAGESEAYVVTAYVPDGATWYPDYKTRK
ncbi:MAG: hypothetical protein COZ06_30475 [Armatimonadetes bacterium CG_4_10_14_3_um_filter_66_18]|nr:DUF4258 domain-containing protein [Armatimonadota bacterium]OIP07308.1 MAG: hypothetical protein AUJ96_07755 [Armatimonadetes bacterium CG2_30_66_41]PIU90031.1 MAG: hypothetical protein COS65_26525 [Armatimonadetes bacterium CG06_land_8_20_14_3_00_66_21]PIX37045.1 MAG: hypothetical protein COZ57_36365 [Armatimonadetes bacterium CG_4_8_14_3_um_filter_66_20]PIY38980.1 MAG: hypothetical protein COZ06_30475 [Armatimonadetes bacterium CG_4_10_14_3_um_filter_66_18]PIZ46042.1 MAG: hypothetical pro